MKCHGQKDRSSTSREHVEQLFSLQQVIFDQLEYIEENQRELPIWGIPPFPNHQVHFHHVHNPPPHICRLINEEMRLVADDFRRVIRHWRALQSKVGRHLDVLIQLRVLDQQDLAVQQSRVALSQQQIALRESQTLRLQSRSVFIFTAITTIFVPLSFFTSYFSMDVVSVLESPINSQYFWAVGGSISGGIVLAVFTAIRIMARSSKVRQLDVEGGGELLGNEKLPPSPRRREKFLAWGGSMMKRAKLKLS
jgi:hypothetical protein